MNTKWNDNYIHIQKGLYISKEDKINTRTDKAFEISLKNLYKKIKNAKQSSSYIEEYHEYILINSTTNICKLFFDIDCNDLLSEDQLKKEIINFKNEISDIILNDIVNNNNFKICYYNGTLTITKDIIIKNIYITKSNSTKKLSLHIFVNNILMETHIFKFIKNIFKPYVKNDLSCLLIKHIDLNIFKEDPILRIPYSIKSNSTDWHMEYGFNLHNKNLYKILFSVYNVKKLLCEIKKNNTFSLENTNTEISNTSLNLLPHQSEFLGYQLYKLLDHSFFKLIKNINELQNLKCVYTNYKFYLELYTEYKNFICICGKTKHKNKHYLLFKDNDIILSKDGNPHSCVIFNLAYPKLNVDQISNFIFKLDLFKKMEDGKIMYWNDVIWQLLDNDHIISNISLKCVKYFNYIDKEHLTIKYFNSAIARLKSHISIQNEKYCDDPYIIQFTNGVYDIKNDVFLKNCKKYICKHNLGFDYTTINELSHSEKDKEIFYRTKLNRLINNIIPPDTYDRMLFECNISTCLLFINKPVITVLIGETCSGKSTIRSLIAKLLNNLYIDYPPGIYTGIIPEKHNPTPNPFLAQCSRKLCSFSSELEKDAILRAVNIKRCTELYIVARNLHENICEHVNTLTQVIDTNFVPSIDSDDPAVLRRLCFIKVNYAYFVNEAEINEKCIKDRTIIERDINLQYEIVSNLYRNAMFELLKEWVRKYHLAGLNLQINTKMNNEYEVKNIDISLEILNTIIKKFSIDSKLIKPDVIRSNFLNYYRIKITNKGSVILMNQYIYNKKYNNIIYNILYNGNLFEKNCVMIDHIDINKHTVNNIPEMQYMQEILDKYNEYIINTLIKSN